MKLVRGLRAQSSVGLPVLSGVLYLGACYVPGVWFVIFVALVPLLLSLQHATSTRDAGLRCFLFGLIVSGGSTFWILQSIVTAPSEFVLLVDVLKLASFALVVLTLSACIACWGPMVRTGKGTGLGSASILSVLWVVLEYVRMHAFNVLTYEAQTGNPAFFSVGFIGYPLADSESFLQVASYGGVFLLGLIAVFINFLFYRSVLRFQAKKSWLPLAGGVVLVIGILVGMPLASLRETFEGKNFKTLSVGIMSLHESGMEKQDLEKKVEELSKEGAKLIVLPEGARFFSQGSEVLMAEPATIIDSSQLTVSGHRRDVFASFAGVPGAEKETFVRSKLVLSPQGEYHVALFSVLFSLFGFENKLEEIGNISRYSAGGIGNAAVLLDGTRASILFCIEMLAPGLGKQLVTEQGSDVLVTLISQRRFTYSYSMQVDTERFLKVQAVEAGVPLVASSNHAPAYAFDAYGRVIKILGANRIGVHAVVDVLVRQD